MRVGSATRKVLVEAGEQAGGEGVGAGGHVDDDVLAGPVDQVVEVELDRAELGVVAGHAEIVLVERAGDHQAYAVHVRADRGVDGLSPASRSSREPRPGGVVLTMAAAEVMRGLSPRRYSLISGRCAPSAGRAVAVVLGEAEGDAPGAG